MNNPRSMVLGWVSLIAVAGASFYFAKQSINERRRQQDIAGERPSARLDVSDGCWFFVKLDLTTVSYLASGSERSARDEARTPQAPRHEPRISSLAPGSPGRRTT
ncbi:hypothetical protein BJV77DRAFT_674562 [Russula vinacea]|nr:hypothetical protein BJV77DRAFT_674562 [Russula vinacea]